MSFHACTALKRPNPACSEFPHFEASDLPDISGLQLLDDDWNNSDGGKFDWEWANEVASFRAEEEGWTYNDCVAALFQGSLLGYSSHPESSEVFGERYVLSAPEHYLHNAPWNDWVPPSRSCERFQKAMATKKPELIDHRIQVRICASANAAGLSNSVIAFAAVEMDSNGHEYLRLRRGAEVLASISLRKLDAFPLSDNFVALVPRTRAKVSCSVYLSVEGDRRKSKFYKMMNQ